MMQLKVSSKSPIGHSIVYLALLFALLGTNTSLFRAEERFEFDHFKTGFELDGQHRQVDCQDCHVQGQFKGTPRECIFCHDGRTAINASTKSLQHVPTAEPCETCHTTNGWNTIVHFEHNAVSGSCASCHNGTSATGKDPEHMATNADCVDCHGTSAWLPAGFNHETVTSNCSSCHNGVNATGKEGDHITTSEECNACHSTQAWIPTTFDHSAVTGNCSACHDGSRATGKSDSHFTTSLECDGCHNTSNWSSIVFSHSSANYPDHQRTIDCADCHRSNSEVLPWPNAALAPDCGACHSNDYKPDAHKKTETPTTVLYPVSELRDCAGACHEYTDNTFTTIRNIRNSEHRVNQGEF